LAIADTNPLSNMASLLVIQEIFDRFLGIGAKYAPLTPFDIVSALRTP
jgi:hypothetical protein